MSINAFDIWSCDALRLSKLESQLERVLLMQEFWNLIQFGMSVTKDLIVTKLETKLEIPFSKNFWFRTCNTYLVWNQGIRHVNF